MPNPSPSSPPPSVVSFALWVTQVLLSITFTGTGVWKLVTPLSELAARMAWMGEVSPVFLRATAALDLLCGLGVLLPSVTRIAPRLAGAAALGGVGLMTGAIIFHLQRGEAASTPFNLVLAALSGFVAWGRLRGSGPARRAYRGGPT